MKVRVIGMKRFDGEVEGKTYHQTTLFAAVLEEETEGLVGNRTTTIKIPDSLMPPVLTIGNEYVVYYGEPNKAGRAKVDFIAEGPKEKRAS